MVIGEIKSLKKGPTKKPLQVRGADNILVNSENRAITLADYFEHIQWKIQFVNLVPSNLADLRPLLPVEVGLCTNTEIMVALMCLSSGKVAGPDEIALELWKLLSLEPESVQQSRRMAGSNIRIVIKERRC